MKNYGITFLCLIFFILPLVSGNDIVLYRKMYYKSLANKREAESFLETMKRNHSNDSYCMAYKGMAYMLMANHAFNPYNKLSYFGKGKMYLEGAIKYNSENVELRFLRFCIQTNAPSFLFYNSDVSEDKEIIIKNWTTLNDADLKLKIKEYMLMSKTLTQQEKNNFR